MNIEIISQIIQNVAVIIASIIAILGVSSWQKELKYRKKYELAEEVLSSFYAAQEALSRVRFPGGYVTEGGTRDSKEYESEADKNRLNRAYVTIERLNKEEETFIKLDTYKYRFQALFGEEAIKPFIEMRTLRSELMFAANQLGAKFWNPDYMRTTEKIPKRNLTFKDEKTKEFETIIWQDYLHSDKDEFKSRIDNAVLSIEATCKKYITK